MKRWLAEISWRWYFWICPNNSKGQEEEHSCNRDHPNWYLRHLINHSINIISTSQMLEAPATTATTAPTSSQHHRGQTNWEHRSSINDSTNQQATTTTTPTLLTKIFCITFIQKINKEEVKLKRKLSQKLIESSVSSPSTPGASSRKYNHLYLQVNS